MIALRFIRAVSIVPSIQSHILFFLRYEFVATLEDQGRVWHYLTSSHHYSEPTNFYKFLSRGTRLNRCFGVKDDAVFAPDAQSNADAAKLFLFHRDGSIFPCVPKQIQECNCDLWAFFPHHPNCDFEIICYSLDIFLFHCTSPSFTLVKERHI